MKPVYLRVDPLLRCKDCMLWAIRNCTSIRENLLISCESAEGVYVGIYVPKPEDGAVLVGHIESKD